VSGAAVAWKSAWEMSDAELLEALKDPRWRLSNLYWITDKDGREVLFQPNEVQARFLDDIWFRNVVPKARQRGFSTVIQILMLDTALFEDNVNAAVVAQDLPSCLKIFRNKIAFAYDRLPALIRKMVPFTSRTKTEIVFANGSTVSVAVSTRSGTYQFLHVSELGIISKTDPDKADEIQSGSLPSVDQNGIIVVESTVEGAAGIFSDMVRRAQSHQQLGIRLNKMQYRLHWASWWDAREYEADPEGIVFTKADLDYFNRAEIAIGRPLSLEKRAWYVLKRDEEFNGNWEKMKSQYPTTIDEAMEVNQEGLWLYQQIAQAKLEGRWKMRLPYDPSRPVHFFWDIGVSDANGVWAGQEDGPWMNWLRYFETWGQPYAVIVGEMQQAGFHVWGKTKLPHDADQRRPGIYQLRSPKDMLEDLKIPNMETVPRTGDLVEGGMEDLRAAFPRYRFDEVGCAEGLVHLEGYSKRWDKTHGRWIDEVDKNGHQHCPDALRQHAQTRHEFNRGYPRPGSRPSRRRNAMTA
jgi:hypothetical protein